MILRRLASPALFACALLAASSTFAQGVQGSIISSPHPIAALAGEPYSATFLTTRHQTLADGTEITRTSKTVRYRDSQGRTRFEDYPASTADNPDPSEPIMISIMDPATSQIIHLFPRQKTASISTLHVTAPPSAPPAPAAGSHTIVTFSTQSSGQPATATHATFEDLGFDTIDGLNAKGRRITRIIPAGAEGNNREIAVVSETWTSPDLHMVVQSKTSDPRSGDSTMEMQNLSRDEPDPALFQVPPDYTVTQ